MSVLKTLTDAQSEALAVAARVGFVGVGSDIQPRDRVSKKRQSTRVQRVTRATIEALVRYRFLVPHPERGAPYYVLTPSGADEADPGNTDEPFEEAYR